MEFDVGDEKCTGNSVCCCGEDCNKKERPDDDTCDGRRRRRMPDASSSTMAACNEWMQSEMHLFSDFVVFVDASCGLSDDACDLLLEGTERIIQSVLEFPLSRVATVQFGGSEDVQVLVALDDQLQRDTMEYLRIIRRNAECTENGHGDTDLYSAMKMALQWLDGSRTTKFVVISACKDKKEELLCKMAKESERLDAYPVNLVFGGNESAENGIEREEAKEYLLCLTDNHPKTKRVCIGDNAFGAGVIERCLFPAICASDLAKN